MQDLRVSFWVLILYETEKALISASTSSESQEICSYEEIGGESNSVSGTTIQDYHLDP